ncbi:predicted protein [Fibroporia radiculosa]|uniref:Uncharacterized protein n=1 Tax=Fibroporia radiculosa TaxID=599839 RepID=J7S6C3_9APHY|nr:predicted protein [Fibroporia radiculosa]
MGTSTPTTVARVLFLLCTEGMDSVIES